MSWTWRRYGAITPVNCQRKKASTRDGHQPMSSGVTLGGRNRSGITSSCAKSATWSFVRPEAGKPGKAVRLYLACLHRVGERGRSRIELVLS